MITTRSRGKIIFLCETWLAISICTVVVQSLQKVLGGLSVRLSFSLAFFWGALSTLATHLN